MTTGKYRLTINWPSGQGTLCGDITDHQYGDICRILSPDYRAELAALKAGQGEAVAHVSEESFSSDGTSDIITRNLPIGTAIYTAPPASADAVSVPRELLDDEGLEAIQEWASGEDQTVNIGQVQGDFDEHIESTAGYAVRLMKELRALLAQSQEVKL